MKKKLLALVVMFALVLTSVIALVACDNTVKHTVTFYNGTQKINEVEIEDGKTIDASYKPDQDGKTFVNWYEDVSLAGDPFDVTTPVKANLKLFGKWQSTTVEADTRIWYIMGSAEGASWSFPTEKNEETGEWSVIEGMESQIMAKAADKNEYSITLTVREGQKFRFVTGAINSDWTGDESKAEAGLGNIVGFEFAAGVNPEGGSEVTADSKEYGCVKSGSDVIFEGGKEFNANPMQWNIFVAEGQEAIYKFTLKTFPGEDDRNEITWERVGDAPVLEVTHDMYIVGSYKSGTNDWKDDYDNAATKMTNKQGTTIWTAQLHVTEEDYASWSTNESNLPDNPTGQLACALKIKNKVSNSDYGVNGGSKNIFLAEGDYLLIYDAADNSVFIEELGYYVVGTIVDGENNVDFAVKLNVTPALNMSGNTGTVVIDIADVSAKAGFTWLAEKVLANDAHPVAAIKVVYGTSYSNKDVGIVTWYNSAADTLKENNDGNYYFASAGKYIVTLTLGEGNNNFTVAQAPAENA